MKYRLLGRTGLKVSVISFGCGPVSGLMTGNDFDAQKETVLVAIEAGINWFDTAPGYGQGTSENNLGRVLAELKANNRVHIATKIRLPTAPEGETSDFIRRSVEESLKRLRISQITLLQLHNGLTRNRNGEPASISPSDVLKQNGVLETFQRLRDEGLIQYLGLTGIGHPESLREVIRSGGFDTLQVPYNLLNPSAGSAEPIPEGEANYGNIIADCQEITMGVFAIRVFAGGALLGQQPSAHTLKTPYFPLALYERDSLRAKQIEQTNQNQMSMSERAIRFALAHPSITSAIIGFGSSSHVRELANFEIEKDGVPHEKRARS